MLNELLNAMMLADLLYDKSVVLIGSRSRAPHQDSRMAPIRILHVDDEPDIREVVQLALGLDPDMVMKSCGSGREALAVAADWKPDLILLDIVMPEMGGAATLGRLRIEVRASTPVVFMTASPKARDPEYFRSLGAAGAIRGRCHQLTSAGPRPDIEAQVTWPTRTLDRSRQVLHWPRRRSRGPCPRGAPPVASRYLAFRWGAGRVISASRRRGGLKADTENLEAAGLSSRLSFGCNRRCLARSLWRRLVVARDHHCPIGAMRGGAFRAGDADARRLGEQQIFSMSARVDPLTERFFETVIAVRNVFRSPPRSRRRDPRIEGPEHLVVKLILGGHCLGLFQRNPVEGCIHGDTPFTVLQTKVGNHLGG